MGLHRKMLQETFQNRNKSLTFAAGIMLSPRRAAQLWLRGGTIWEGLWYHDIDIKAFT